MRFLKWFVSFSTPRLFGNFSIFSDWSDDDRARCLPRWWEKKCVLFVYNFKFTWIRYEQNTSGMAREQLSSKNSTRLQTCIYALLALDPPFTTTNIHTVHAIDPPVWLFAVIGLYLTKQDVPYTGCTRSQNNSRRKLLLLLLLLLSCTTRWVSILVQCPSLSLSSTIRLHTGIRNNAQQINLLW